MTKKAALKDHLYDGPSLEIEENKFVKNLEAKKQRPSIFIGSSSEAHIIAKKIQECFNADEFEVDTWKMSVFGAKYSDGQELTIAEQLKNFTDIYDFAIFIFAPDQETTPFARIDSDTKQSAVASSVIYNVIFEFGLFLGRLGARRSIILYHEDVKDFINLFFTDLKDEFNTPDNESLLSKNFKLEIRSFKGDYKKYLAQGKTETPFETNELSSIVKDLEKKILEYQKEVTISFLPSTSLAHGYYNNFVYRLYDCFEILLKGKVTNQSEYPQKETVVLNEIIHTKKEVIFKMIIPRELNDATYKVFTQYTRSNKLVNASLGAPNGRPISLYVQKSSLQSSHASLVIYDFPSAINSSIQAIEFTTQHNDIRELLSEKEKRNFIKVMQSILHEKGAEVTGSNTTFKIEFIDLKKFEEEIENP